MFENTKISFLSLKVGEQFYFVSHLHVINTKLSNSGLYITQNGKRASVNPSVKIIKFSNLKEDKNR